MLSYQMGIQLFGIQTGSQLIFNFILDSSVIENQIGSWKPDW